MMNATNPNFMKMIHLMNSTNKSNSFKRTFRNTGMIPTINIETKQDFHL